MIYARKTTRTAEKTEYIFDLGNGKEKSIFAYSPSQAVAIITKRGAAGLGSGWTMSRERNGWIVASNKNQKPLERTRFRLKEANWSRTQDQRVD